MCVPSEDWRKCIGKNIRTRREQNKLTRPQLAEKMHYSDEMIKRHEKGECLTFDRIPAYAAVFGCTPGELLITEYDNNDPVFRACSKIKSVDVDAQKCILGIVDRSLDLLKM